MSQYATTSELAIMGGIPAALLLAKFSPQQQNDALTQASGVADGFFGSEYGVPLAAWGTDVKMRVCQLAAWFLMSSYGFDPDGMQGKLLIQARDSAMEWMAKVGNGDIALIGEVDATPSVDETAPFIISDPPRGW